MLLNYFAIWRDIESDSRDIQGVIDNLQERNFPFSHGFQANPNNFRYLHTDKRTLLIGVSVADLPPYVFEMDLQPNRSRAEIKKRQGFFEKLFATPPQPQITKFSKQDSNLLLGAKTSEKLIDLVKRCGFQIRDVDDIFERLNVQLRYQAIYNGQVFRKSNGLEILNSLMKLGATLDNYKIENPTKKSLPPEKQNVTINGEPVKLYPFIFQVKVVPVSPIVYGDQKPYWLVLGAKTGEDLNELIEFLGINRAETIISRTQSFQRSSIPKEVKIHVWRRDKGKCVECGSKERLEFDHIIPLSKGGSNTARNIQILCERCNRKKSNKLG